MRLADKLKETSLSLYALEWKQQEILLVAYKQSLDDIRGNLSGIWQKYAKDEKLSITDVMQEKRLMSLQQQIVARINKLSGEANKVIENSIREGYTQSYMRTGWAVETFTGIDMKFGMVSEKQVRAAINGPVKWGPALQTHMTATAAKINATIITGIIQGKGYKAMHDELTGQLNISAGKTMRILRTDTHRAQVTGRIEGLDETAIAANKLGLKMVRSWLSTGDERTRESHVAMSGVEADKNNMFHLPSGALTAGPGLSGIPEEDYNCRCDIVADFPDLDGEPEFEAGDQIGESPLYCML